jgi:phage/plasmid-associated DNA primase
VEAYKITNNSVLSFVYDCCGFDDERYAELGEVYRKYKEFCEENGLKAVSKIRMSKEFKENFENISPTEDKVSKRVIYKGLYIL